MDLLELRIATWLYISVVVSFTWPRMAWIILTSAPFSSISVAIARRKRWQEPVRATQEARLSRPSEGR